MGSLPNVAADIIPNVASIPSLGHPVTQPLFRPRRNPRNGYFVPLSLVLVFQSVSEYTFLLRAFRERIVTLGGDWPGLTATAGGFERSTWPHNPASSPACRAFAQQGCPRASPRTAEEKSRCARVKKLAAARRSASPWPGGAPSLERQLRRESSRRRHRRASSEGLQSGSELRCRTTSCVDTVEAKQVAAHYTPR